MEIYFLSSNTKKGVLFQGDDRRDFWVRAEDRNHSSVKKFSTILFAYYEVIELFKRYNFYIKNY